jgi:hypothetical protein
VNGSPSQPTFDTRSLYLRVEESTFSRNAWRNVRRIGEVSGLAPEQGNSRAGEVLGVEGCRGRIFGKPLHDPPAAQPCGTDLVGRVVVWSELSCVPSG